MNTNNGKHITKIQLNNFKKILVSFDEKCKSKNIWYSLSDHTLLSAKLQKNYFDKYDYLSVFMTLDSFNLFLKYYSEYIIDSSINSSYCYLTPFYKEKNQSIAIQIQLLVPTVVEKLEKFYSISNLVRQNIGYYLSNKKITNFKSFFNIIFYKIASWFKNPLVWKEIYSKISDENKYNGYFVLDNLNNNINVHWIPSLSFKLNKINFLEHEFLIINECHLYLQKKFGINYDNEIKLKPIKKFNWICFL